MYLILQIIICTTLFGAYEAQVLRLNGNNISTKLFSLSNMRFGNFLSGTVPDADFTVPQMIQEHDYPVEIHTVQTEDQYLLTVHRIPYGKKNSTKENRKPIFLMHGILASSADYVLMGPERSLGFLLADMGYDVWMGNARGNRYSRRHRTLDPIMDADQFWNFSWHEIGIYDLPAMIDYILDKTNNTKLRYIGHSQGCTTFFVMNSMRPEYNKKIVVMFALAPAVFMGHARSPLLRYGAKYLFASRLILYIFGRNEFLPNKAFMRDLSAVLCNRESIIQGICENTLFMLAGFDEAQMDLERLPVMLANTPAGCSTKQIVHFLQNTRNTQNRFNLFDYGPMKNMMLYSSVVPAQYPLDKVTAHVALFSGYNDLFVDIKDVDKLSTKLPNVFLNYRVPFDAFTHLDFLWAKDAVPLLYNVVFKHLDEFN